MGRSWSVLIILFILKFSEPYSQENNENINITRMIASLQYICQLVHFCSLYYIYCCITDHAKQWIGCLGKLLRDSAKENLFQLSSSLEVSKIH